LIQGFVHWFSPFCQKVPVFDKKCPVLSDFYPKWGKTVHTTTAKAGQANFHELPQILTKWIPASAGMTPFYCCKYIILHPPSTVLMKSDKNSDNDPE
jgi:hypothetical protein